MRGGCLVGRAKYESAGGDFSAESSGLLGCGAIGGEPGVSGFAGALVILRRRRRLMRKKTIMAAITATTATTTPAMTPTGAEEFETTETAVELGFAGDADDDGVVPPFVDVESSGETIGTIRACAFVETGSACPIEKFWRS